MNVSEWVGARLTLESPDAILLLAAVLVAGALVGELIARTTRAPRVVGYAAAGFAVALMGPGTAVPLAGATRLVIDLALALLLFEIGACVRLRWFRNNPGLLATSLFESLLGAGAVYLAMSDLGLGRQVAAACAVLAVPASAAVAGRVALEINAAGQVTERMKHLTALNTLYGVLALMALNGWVQAESTPDWPATLQTLAGSVMGSLALAALLAGAVSLAARRLDLRNESSVLLVLGLVLLTVSAARWLGLSTLLVPLMAGLVLRNTNDRPWVWPRHFGTAGGVLVLMMFVFVGAAWSPEVLAAGGVAALALVVARGLGKGLAVLALSRWARASLRQGVALSVTLTPLSATALVLLSELILSAPELGREVAPIIMTAVAVLELLGPIAVQMALHHAGELSGRAATRKEPR